MTNVTQKVKNSISRAIKINESSVTEDLGEMVRKSVEETINEMLNSE